MVRFSSIRNDFSSYTLQLIILSNRQTATVPLMRGAAVAAKNIVTIPP